MSDSEQVTIVRNRDNDNLGVWANERMVVGYVENVNGPGAREFPEFTATEHELITLVKHWAQVALDIEWFWFLYAQVGSSETRENAFAHRRTSRIADVVGQEVVAKAVDEVWEDFGKRQDARAWGIFLHGDEEQVRAFQDEVQDKLDESTRKNANGHGDR